MRRFLLYGLVGSLALNAALGIAALLSGGFGQLQRRVLFTSLCVSGAGMLALACAPAWERRRAGILPIVGAAAAAGGFALLSVVIWTKPESDTLSKAAGTLLVVAAAAAAGSLLSLASLAPRFRFAYPVAAGLGLLLAAMGISLIWGQWQDSQWFARALGVVAVLFAAFTLLVPVLHRASREELVAALAVAGGAPVRFCPCCGARVSLAAGVEGTCPGCGTRFEVRFARTGTPLERGVGAAT